MKRSHFFFSPLTGFLTALAILSLTGASQGADQMEKCFAISAAGQNDGMASGSDAEMPASSTLDYDGEAWKFVKKGQCQQIETPYGKGSLTPLKGHPPKK